MPDVEINDLASLGAILDIPPYMLPPEAWSLALNVRFTNRGVERLLGWEQIFGTPGVAPHFVMPISTVATNYWLYAGLTKIYVFDGSTHADITRAVGGNYGATETYQWNGTILGGIPIFNNNVDVPQFRANMTAGTKFADLTNWPATLRAAVIRSFGPYLMAFNLTESGTSKPHTIAWSHPADPGSIPSSWDHTDPTVDAGRKDLEDVNSGIILEALPLGGQMFIYKENSTWRAVPIGGRFIFDFKTVFETSGILAPRCVALTADGKRHCVVTQDDMIWHNGSQVVSILDQRDRETLFSEMDTVNYYNSFLFDYPLRGEMWFCYPTAGQIQANKALIWNYRQGGEKGVVSFVDGITFRNAAIGNVEGDSSELWSDGTDEWDVDTGPWSEFARRRVVLVGTDATKFYNLDKTATRDGVSFSATLRREGLSIIGRTRQGQWIEDHQVNKMWQRLWPKIQGGPVNIRVGAAEIVNGAVTWGPYVSFDPALGRTADIDPVSGAAIAIEFTTTANVSWRLDGYKASITPLGQF